VRSCTNGNNGGTMAEAAEIPGVTERTFCRYSDRYDTEGPRGYRTGGSADLQPGHRKPSGLRSFTR